MALSISGLKTRTPAESTGGQGNGIFISKVKITSIKAYYGEKQRWQKLPDDIGIEMTLDIGRDFEPTFYVGGAFKRDEFGDILSLGTVKKVDILFDSMGMDVPFGEDNIVSEDVLNDCVGREFLRLSYVSGEKDNGKSKWSDWQETRSVDTSKEDFTKDFMNAVLNGWVRNYEPSTTTNPLEDKEDLAL